MLIPSYRAISEEHIDKMGRLAIMDKTLVPHLIYQAQEFVFYTFKLPSHSFSCFSVFFHIINWR